MLIGEFLITVCTGKQGNSNSGLCSKVCARCKESKLCHMKGLNQNCFFSDIKYRQNIAKKNCHNLSTSLECFHWIWYHWTYSYHSGCEMAQLALFTPNTHFVEILLFNKKIANKIVFKKCCAVLKSKNMSQPIVFCHLGYRALVLNAIRSLLFEERGVGH